jgi:hypothetical protein
MVLFRLQFEALLKRRQPLETISNMNALWAHLIVEELCRVGVTVSSTVFPALYIQGVA